MYAPRTKSHIQKACILAGIPMIVLWILGFWLLADFLPPPDPSDSAAEIAERYRDDKNAIRAGMVALVFGSTLLCPFVCMISVLIRRMEGPSGPLATIQLALGTLLVFEFIYPAGFIWAGTYREDRSDEAIQTLNDTAWLLFVGIASTAVLQFIVIGVAILVDSSSDPLLPRWSGYYTIWTGLTFVPADLIVFFKDGPFAWNGFLSWWVAVTCFCAWLVVMSFLMLRAVNRDSDQTPDSGTRHDAGLERRVDAITRELAGFEAKLERLTDEASRRS